MEEQMFVCLDCEIGSEHERGSGQSCPHCGKRMEPLEPVDTSDSVLMEKIGEELRAVIAQGN